MAWLISEFCLQKEIGSRYRARAISGGQPLAYSGLEVMPPLVRRVDAAKAHPQSELGKRGRAIFFPGGAIQKIGES